jgi:hypothetical protein
LGNPVSNFIDGRSLARLDAMAAMVSEDRGG